MFTLKNNDTDEVVMKSYYEMSGSEMKLEDNTSYSFSICNDYCGDLSFELFINEVMCKKIDVDTTKKGCLTFRTKVGDKVNIRQYPKYDLPIC